MFAKIVGLIWAILGLLWLLKPETLKKYLKKKMSRIMKRRICGFILVAGLLLAASAIRIAGILPKIVALAGIVIAVRSGFLFTSKASDQIFDTLVERPLSFFRIGAFFILVIGLVMVFI